MVTASFSLQKTLQIPAPDPEKKGAARIQRELEEILDASVKIPIDGQNTVSINDEKVADLAGLGGLLREKMRMDAQNRTEVVLEIDPHALHGTVVQVVDACNEAGMQKIRLAATAAE
jgi:biopolymer transport protein ExbD